MKMFTKLALVSSMAISANAMAMQSMDDAALSAATGQDGINIGIGISKIEIEKVLIHDNDGLGGTAANAGAIVIKGNGLAASTTNFNSTNGIVITAPMDATGTAVDNTRALASHNLADLTIDTDKGTGTNGAFLNVAAAVSGLDIYIGEIGVSGSNAASTTAVRRGNDTANYNAILSGLTIKTGVTSANIQLGAAPQGAMIVLNTTMQGGLEIKNLGIIDSSTKQGSGDGTANNRAAGQIYLDSIKVADAPIGAAAATGNLTVNAAVSVVGKEGSNNGYLRIITGSGATTPKTDMYIKGVRLGSQAAASIGDVEVQGLQTYYYNGAANVQGSVITISGH